MCLVRRLAVAHRLVATALLASALLCAASPVAAQTDLDALMARVLDNRTANWTRLQEFLLTERERFSLEGPDLARLYGLDREFVWVARDGKAVRALTRVNGVAVSQETADADVREHEEKGLGEFMRFPFEPGNYYLAGREQMDGVDVLRIEYYPTRLFGPDADEQGKSDDEAAKGRRRRDPDEERLDIAFNKVSQVTLWVDPAAEQIVKAVFENVDFSFLPGRSLVRVEEARGILEMGRPIPGVWLPVRTTIEGAVTLATGTYRATYRRDFFDYRQTDVKVRFRFHEGPP